MADEIEVDFSAYVPMDRGFEGGDPGCMHGAMADWDGEDSTRDLDVCKYCGATRVRRWK